MVPSLTIERMILLPRLLRIGQIALLFVFANSGSTYAQRPLPVILDADLGNDIDDEFALALAVQSPELNVRGVTVVGDNVEDRMRLAWKELGLYGRTDIETGRGAPEPLLDSTAITYPSHLNILTREDLLPPAVNNQAVTLINNAVRYSSAKVTLIATGPLTDIALALKIDPRVKQNIARIIFAGDGFSPPRAEYNIQRDLLAAEIVFSSGVPITLIGRDVVHGCSLEGADLDRMRAAENPASRFLVSLIELWQKENSDAHPALLDPVAVAVSFRPDLISSESGTIAIDLKDGAARFLPVAGLSSGQQPQVALARELNCPALLDLLVKRLSVPPRSAASVAP